MAMDLSNSPDWIDRQKKAKIQQGTHPYADNPAFPSDKPSRRPGAPFPAAQGGADPTRSYSELVSSNAYNSIVSKVGQYTGQDPRRINPNQLGMEMMRSLQQAVRVESAHRRELEQAAVEIVLSLPEFRDAREAVASGDLKIEARLMDPDAMMQQMQRKIRGAVADAEEEEDGGQMQVDPDEPNEQEQVDLGLNVPEIRSELDAEAKKRKFINLMIQGAAIIKNYAYHLIADRLREIDPHILTTYGKLMSIGELFYWVMPEENLNSMMGSGAGGGGMEEVVPEDDGTYTIRAHAIVFPVLIQELAKGLYEFLSFNEDDPEDVRKHTYRVSDTLGGEQWDIMKGPGVWRHFSHLVDQAGGADLMGKVYRHIVTQSAGEFNRIMNDILKETPSGKKYLSDLVSEIKAEEGGRQEESLARSLITGR